MIFMSRGIFWKKMLFAIIAGAFCIASARIHTFVTSELGYTDPDGQEWKYKKTLSKIKARWYGPEKITYRIYTNQKNIQFDNVYESINGNEYIVCIYRTQTEGAYPQFYLLEETTEAIPTPTPPVYYVNKAGVEFISNEYDTVYQLCKRKIITEEYFEHMNQAEVDFFLSDDSFWHIYEFNYKEELEKIFNNDIVYTEGFAYQEQKDALPARQPKQGQLVEIIKKTRQQILKRAEKEKKDKFEYRGFGLPVYHAKLNKRNISVDFENRIVKICFYEEGGLHKCYVYIGFDGLTRKVIQTRREI